MRISIFLLVVLFIFCHISFIFGQNIDFSFQSLNKGLSQNNVRCILKDSKGYLWFGTSDGLNKYEGNKFIIYKNNFDDSTSLSDNIINTIIEDKNHNLWIGTTNGLNLFQRKKNNFIRFKHNKNDNKTLSHNHVKALYEDSNGNMWIGTYGGGLNLFDKQKNIFIRYLHSLTDSNTITHNYINVITEDKKHNIWIGTIGGLNLYDKKHNNFINYYNDKNNINSLSSNHIYSLCSDANENLWVGTRNNGLNRITKNKQGKIDVERFKYDNKNDNSVSNNNILSLYIDNKNRLFIGTENGGLNVYDLTNKQFTHYYHDQSNENSLSSNSIWSIYEDDTGILWFGTYNQGLCFYNKHYSKFRHFKQNIYKPNSLNDNDITCFYESTDSIIYIGTDGGGINIFNRKTLELNHITANNKSNSIINNTTLSIFLDSDNNLFSANWAGGLNIRLANNSDFTNYIYSEFAGNSIKNENIVQIHEDKKGNIWLGSVGKGLHKFDKKRNKIIQLGLSNDVNSELNIMNVFSIIDDYENNIWFGTYSGLFLLKSDRANDTELTQFTHIENDTNSLSNNRVIVLFEDNCKNLWVGTEGGGLNLFNYSDSSFTKFRDIDGLANNTIRGIVEDDNGILWISTNNGISRFDRQSKTFRNYDSEDGLQANEFSRNSCFKSKSGELFFGGVNGFNCFYPNEVIDNQYIPPVYITDFKLFNKDVAIGTADSPLKNHISETKEITLNYKQTVFTLGFTALNYTHPAKNSYAYILEGLEKKWNYVNTKQTATYTNLDPGEYIFKVKGSNNDGVWNETPTTLKINILPPPYKTTLAYIIYIILFIVGLYAFLKLSGTRTKEKNELKIEKLKREKEEEINSMKLQFFTNISHEFRTPLTLILGPLESIINNKTIKGKVFQQITLMYRNASRLLRLIDELMDFRKLEKNKLKIAVKKSDIVQFVSQICDFFTEHAQKHQIEFSFVSEQDVIHTYFDKDKIDKVLFNLLSNAFKYTSQNNKIVVSVSTKSMPSLTAQKANKQYDKLTDDKLSNDKLSNKYVQITVTDNGKGISSEHIQHIFERFYRVNNTKVIEQSGTGIGLSLTKSLVELHHGTITVRSEEYKETCFTVLLPLSKEHFTKEEIFSNAIETKDVETKDIETKDIETKDIETKDIETKDIETKDIETKDIVNKQTSTKAKTTVITDKPIHSEDTPLVLIVEDNIDIREYLKQELSIPFRIIEADNGKKGISKAMENIPDLIISDIIMPKMNGLELCKELKTDMRTSHIPIILLTARTNIENKIEGVDTGADLYVTKPFNIEYLTVQAKKIIETRRKLIERFSGSIKITPKKLSTNKLDENFLQQIIDYIENNIDDPELTVESLASKIAMSRSQAYRKIKALTGQTATEFIRTLRLNKAIVMLETNKLSVSEIAYKVGFSSPSYFTKCFREKFGKLPSEYSKKT